MSVSFEPPRTIRIVGAGSCLGAPIFGPAAGPRALRAWGLDAYLRQRGCAAEWHTLLEPSAPKPPQTPLPDRIAIFGQVLAELAEHTATVHASGALPLVLGGDHGIGAGTWRGIARSLAPRGKLGLIWIDAHLDAHTPATTHTGNLHGMPLAALLGIGDPAFTAIPGPHLDPANVVIVGARSWEPEEPLLLQRLGVTVIGIEEVRRRGLATVLDEAMGIARQGTAAFGVSVDLDVLDCAQFPATTCLVPNGLSPQELVNGLYRLRAQADLAGLEIVEYVPERDRDGSGARWVGRIAEAVLGPGAAAFQPPPKANDTAPDRIFVRGAGAALWDVEGHQYWDFNTQASGALLGHAHPRLLAALHEQASRLAWASAPQRIDSAALLEQRLATRFGYARAALQASADDALRSAVLCARAWAAAHKPGTVEAAEVLICGEQATAAAALPGCRWLALSDIQADVHALEAAISPKTVALIAPTFSFAQPLPADWSQRCAEMCHRHGLMWIADLRQGGLVETTLNSLPLPAQPDGMLFGNELGGGLLPSGAVLVSTDLAPHLPPGPSYALAAAVAQAVLDEVGKDAMVAGCAELVAELAERLTALRSPLLRAVHLHGVWIGLQLDSTHGNAEGLREALLARGIVAAANSAGSVLLSPPLAITAAELQQAAEQIAAALAELAGD